MHSPPLLLLSYVFATHGTTNKGRHLETLRFELSNAPTPAKSSAAATAVAACTVSATSVVAAVAVATVCLYPSLRLEKVRHRERREWSRSTIQYHPVPPSTSCSCGKVSSATRMMRRGYIIHLDLYKACLVILLVFFYKLFSCFCFFVVVSIPCNRVLNKQEYNQCGC